MYDCLIAWILNSRWHSWDWRGQLQNVMWRLSPLDNKLEISHTRIKPKSIYGHQVENWPLDQIEMETSSWPAPHRHYRQQSPRGYQCHTISWQVPQSPFLFRTFLVLLTVLWLFSSQQMQAEPVYTETEMKPMNQPSVWLRELPEQTSHRNAHHWHSPDTNSATKSTAG